MNFPDSSQKHVYIGNNAFLKYFFYYWFNPGFNVVEWKVTGQE